MNDVDVLIPNEVIPPPVDSQTDMCKLDTSSEIIRSECWVTRTIFSDPRCSDNVVKGNKIIWSIKLL